MPAPADVRGGHVGGLSPDMTRSDVSQLQLLRNSFSTGTRWRLFAAAAVLAAALVLVAVADAAACTCRAPDLRRDLPAADGAVVGSVLEKRVGASQTTFLLRVEQVYKGDISNRVEVVTNAQSATCGLELAVGERVGLLLERVSGEWRSGLCSQVDPDEFLALTDVEDNSLPEINLGGWIVGFTVLALAAWLLWRRRRRYSGLR